MLYPKEQQVLRICHLNYASKIAYDTHISYSHVFQILSRWQKLKLLTLNPKGRITIVTLHKNMLELCKAYQNVYDIEKSLNINDDTKNAK